MELQIHSITDLITNSSTTIYTYSEDSPKALEEMINEIFDICGVKERCSDIFDTVVLFSNYYSYSDNELCPENLDWSTVQSIYDDVVSGKIKKPDWFSEVELSCQDDSDDGFSPSTTMYLIPKDSKYEKLSKLIKNFLYSTNHDGGYTG